MLKYLGNYEIFNKTLPNLPFGSDTWLFRDLCKLRNHVCVFNVFYLSSWLSDVGPSMGVSKAAYYGFGNPHLDGLLFYNLLYIL